MEVAWRMEGEKIRIARVSAAMDLPVDVLRAENSFMRSPGT
jgi:hypothetical protein